MADAQVWTLIGVVIAGGMAAFFGLRSEIRRLDERFDRVDQRFDAIYQRFDGIYARLDQLGARLDQLGRRLDRVLGTDDGDAA